MFHAVIGMDFLYALILRKADQVRHERLEWGRTGKPGAFTGADSGFLGAQNASKLDSVFPGRTGGHTHALTLL
jgi:hypothetical protein